jgi:hypothetical protein
LSKRRQPLDCGGNVDGMQRQALPIEATRPH